MPDENPDGEERTFEELCRAHIEKFAKGAEKYAAETKLSLRVGKWQDRLEPILQEEEQRPAFDIHGYSRDVIDAMVKEIRRASIEKGDTQVVDFREIVGDCPSHEVCRKFLACLSLTNSGNVAPISNGSPDCSSLQLELLNSQIERPMETYLAPSVAEELMTN